MSAALAKVGRFVWVTGLRIHVRHRLSLVMAVEPFGKITDDGGAAAAVIGTSRAVADHARRKGRRRRDVECEASRGDEAEGDKRREMHGIFT